MVSPLRRFIWAGCTEVASQAENICAVVNDVFSSNTYLLPSRIAGNCVVIDPGLDTAALETMLADTGWKPEAVICTHGHFDHIGGAAKLQTNFNVPVYLHSADVKVAKMSNFLLSAFKIDQRITLPDFELVSGTDPTLQCAGRSFLFHSVPGHTPGSVAIEADGMLFSGDSLYARRLALSQLPGEDAPMLRTSLRRLFTRVSLDTLVLPGHGRSSVLREILEENDELLDFLALVD